MNQSFSFAYCLTLATVLAALLTLASGCSSPDTGSSSSGVYTRQAPQ